eukprot:scaffold261211_cov30-Tisochrysis_lutea.AAC.2
MDFGSNAASASKTRASLSANLALRAVSLTHARLAPRTSTAASEVSNALDAAVSCASSPQLRTVEIALAAQRNACCSGATAALQPRLHRPTREAEKERIARLALRRESSMGSAHWLGGKRECDALEAPIAMPVLSLRIRPSIAGKSSCHPSRGQTKSALIEKQLCCYRRIERGERLAK